MALLLGRSFVRIALASLGILGGAGGLMAACSSSDDGGGSDVDSGTDTGGVDSTKADSGATDSGSPDAVKDSALVDTTEAGCSPVDAGPLDDAAVARGLAFVEANKCKGCHTPDLSGTTTAISGAFPKNLTSDQTGLACLTDEQIIRAFTAGIGPDGTVFCVMPKFASLDDAGSHDLLAFLRSLPPVKKIIPETVCPADAGADGDAPGDGG